MIFNEIHTICDFNNITRKEEDKLQRQQEKEQQVRQIHQNNNLT